MNGSLERGATLGVLTVAAERGLSFVTLLLVARVLEPERFGLYVYLLAGLMPIQVMADQGLEVAATSLMSRRGRTSTSALAMVLLGRVGLWAMVGVPVALLVLPSLSGCSSWTAVAASLTMLVGPSLPYRTLYRARGEMERVWWLAASDAAGVLAATGVVLLGGGGVAAVFVVRAAVGVGITIETARRSGLRPRPGRGWRRVVRRLARDAWPLALNAALLTFIVRTGQLIAMTILGGAAVGVLGAAARVAEMLSMIAEGVMMAAFPAMASQPRRAARIADDVAGALGLVVGWAVAVVAAGSHAIVGLLYGPAYEAAGSVLAILAWGGLVSAAGAVAFYRLIVAGRHRLLLRVNAAAAAVAVVLHLPLIWAAGVVGAAVATVLTLVSGQALLCWDGRARRAVLAVWRRVLPAAVLAAGAVAAGRVVGVGWVAAAAALVIYPALAAAAGLVREPERRALRALWGVVTERIAGPRGDG